MKSKIRKNIISAIQRKKTEQKRNPLWGKPGYVMGVSEMKKMFASMKPPPVKFPPGCPVEDRIQLLKNQIGAYEILSDSPLTWPEESSYLGEIIK